MRKRKQVGVSANTPPKQPQPQIHQGQQQVDSDNTATTNTATTPTHTSTDASEDEHEDDDATNKEDWEKSLLAMAADANDSGTMVVRDNDDTDDTDQLGTFVMRDDGSDTNEPDIFGAKERNVFNKDFWEDSPTEPDLPTTLEEAHALIRRLQQEIADRDKQIEKYKQKMH